VDGIFGLMVDVLADVRAVLVPINRPDERRRDPRFVVAVFVFFLPDVRLTAKHTWMAIFDFFLGVFLCSVLSICCGIDGVQSCFALNTMDRRVSHKPTRR